MHSTFCLKWYNSPLFVVCKWCGIHVNTQKKNRFWWTENAITKSTINVLSASEIGHHGLHQHHTIHPLNVARGGWFLTASNKTNNNHQQFKQNLKRLNCTSNRPIFWNNRHNKTIFIRWYALFFFANRKRKLRVNSRHSKRNGITEIPYQ